jgi:hypothetical protein
MNHLSPIKENFAWYIKSHWASLYKEEGNPGKNPKEALARACALYDIILNQTSPFVVIGPGVRSNAELKANIGLLNSSSKEKKSSKEIECLALAILGENPWSLLINDIFMLGVIHRACEVHLALPDGKMPTKDLLWDEKKKKFKPLGRELVILSVCHFQRIEAPECMGMIFAPPQKSEDHATLTLSELRERISSLTVQEIQRFLRFRDIPK